MGACAAGFTDGEGNFSIVPKANKEGKVNRFIFMFVIGLHKDDSSALIKIQAYFNIGKVSANKNECKFVVTKQEDISKLISIFDKYTLNTSKYLDYLDFKKAFTLYSEREGLVTEQLKDNILALKHGMNTTRNNFTMPPSHNISINKN